MKVYNIVFFSLNLPMIQASPQESNPKHKQQNDDSPPHPRPLPLSSPCVFKAFSAAAKFLSDSSTLGNFRQFKFGRSRTRAQFPTVLLLLSMETKTVLALQMHM
jgi:hypothetical protein